MVYGAYKYSYWGESKPTNITGGAHIVIITPSGKHTKNYGKIHHAING